MTSWQDISALKCSERDSLIPPAWRLPSHYLSTKMTNVMDVARRCGILTPAELAITELSAPALVNRMLSRNLSSVAVVTAFCKRAAVAQQLTNCLTEIMFTQAIATAEAIDAEYAKTGRARGALHGLPISLKDNIDVPGFDSSTGFIANVGDKAFSDAELVRVLRAEGAVFHCKTNVPTGMILGETYNNVWGLTTNPHNTQYACGGSSGGEGVLLALRGSPLGVGSDIAGSIRLPSAACGIYGLKPSTHRISMMGMRAGAGPGQESIRPVTGPMSADLASLELMARVAVGKGGEHDHLMVPMRWREVTLPTKLCFGLVLDDGVVRPTPAVARVLLETKAALEAAGHNVVVWTPPNVSDGIKLLFRLMQGDSGAAFRATMVGGANPEPWPRGLEYVEKTYQRTKDRPTPVSAQWKLNIERTAYLSNLLSAWDATRKVSGTGRPFDGLISPVTAFPACPHYTFAYTGYCCLWNLADFSAVSFPAGNVKRADVKSEMLSGGFRNADEKSIWDHYDVQQLAGMPVGLQVVTPRYTEEKAIKLATVIDKAIGVNSRASSKL